MNFNLNQTIEILERTPEVLYELLHDIPSEWTSKNEGGETWNVFDVIGHLVHAEKTDWIIRVEIILSSKSEKIFEDFDRYAQIEDSKGKTLNQLLIEFKNLRQKNLEQLISKNITDEHLKLKGIHPAFGEVTLEQLIATWAVHDLNHISQISRIMAKQYKTEVGPWSEYLSILHK